MRERYGDFVEHVELIELNPDNVPDQFIEYLPYAALWGVTDNDVRDELVDIAPENAKDDLIRVVKEIDASLDDWLAGGESYAASPSREYLAFSCLRLAGDSAMHD